MIYHLIDISRLFVFFLLVVYDVSNRQSFQKLDQWLYELETYSTRSNIVKMLVANKIDKVFMNFIIYKLLLLILSLY